jgi:hypothetical protein
LAFIKKPAGFFMRIRRPKDFLAGGMFFCFGVAAMGLSLNLTIGSAAQMGPGYFPFALGAFLVVLGVVILLRGLRGAGGLPEWPALQFKPLATVLLSVVLFSLILRPLGLLLATALLVVLASRASHEFRWQEAVLNAAVLTVVVLAVFVFFLEFQLPIWPAFMTGRV